MDDEFVRLFIRTAKAVRDTGATLLARHGVHPGQDLVLRELRRQDGQTPKELADRLGVAGPTAVKMAQRMEQSGLVSRRRDDADGRLVRVYLTRRGRSVHQPIERDVQRLGEHLLAGLSPAERRSLERSLRKILESTTSWEK